MNLRDLHYLLAVAKHLHYGKAAISCHISQPTLSMQLKKLEEELGVQLLERTNKSVMLTPIGREIAQRAGHILGEAEQIRQLARNAGNPLSGDFRLGVFPTLAPYLLTCLVPKLKRLYPKLNLLLIEEKTDALLRQLEDGSIDCALLAMPVAADHLAAATLFREEFYLAVPAAHPLAKRKTISSAELENLSLLLLDEGHCLRDQALLICHTLGAGEADNFRATSLETLRHMVAAGNAVTLMPRLAVQPKDPLLRCIPFKAPAPARTIGLYWRKTSARSEFYVQLSRQANLWPCDNKLLATA